MEWEATEAHQRVHHPFPGTVQIRDACGGLPENLYSKACLIKDPNVWDYGSCSVAKLCPALCDPMDCSPPGFAVHGFFQAMILEWVVISSSRGIFLTQGLKPHLLH